MKSPKMSQTTIYLSNTGKDVSDHIRMLLLNYDLEIARAEAEIKLREEKMDFVSGSTKKKDLSNFTLWGIERDNYLVFIGRLKSQKKDLLKQVGLIVGRYGEDFSDIFTYHFIENKTEDEIAELKGMKPETVRRVISRIGRLLIKF